MASSNTEAAAEVSAGQAGKARSPAPLGELTAENRGPLKHPENDKFCIVFEGCIPASSEQAFQMDQEVVDIPDYDKETDA